MQVVKHVASIVAQRPGHVDVAVEVHPHHGLELPQGQDHRALGVVHVRDGVGERGLRPGQVEFGSALRVVTALDLLIILQGVLIGGPVHLEGLAGQQTGKVGLLDLVHRLEARAARLLDGELHVLVGDPEVLPQLGVDQRHAGAHARGPGVPAAHLDAASALAGRLSGGSHVRSGIISAATEGAHVKIHVHHLLLDGPLIGPRAVDLREQGCVGALAGISDPFDLLVRHFDGRVLAQRNPERVLEGQQRRGRRGVGRLGQSEYGEKGGYY